MDEQTAERLDRIGLRDHSVTPEYRIFGPPGTGKTTNLTRQIRRAVDRFGDSSVLVTSFSKATAAELTGRDTPIDLDRIGTLHSHCFHALGKPMIAEVHVGDWNRRYPRLKITPVSRKVRLEGEDATEDDGQAREGDCLLQQLNRCRGMMLGFESWPAVVRDFASQWTKYKSANRLLDFCDLIDVSIRDVPAAPHRPSVLVVDEAQDLNRMQLTLIRSWSECARYLVLAGDDDQTIYAWAGASPEAILDPEVPEDHKVFLKESVRVPRAVHAVAERLIRQVSRRQEKTYRPRHADGEVVRLSRAGYPPGANWRCQVETEGPASESSRAERSQQLLLVLPLPARRAAAEWIDQDHSELSHDRSEPRRQRDRQETGGKQAGCIPRRAERRADALRSGGGCQPACRSRGDPLR